MVWWTCHYYHEGWVFFEGQQCEGVKAILCLWVGVYLQEVEYLGVWCQGSVPLLCHAYNLQC